MTFMVFDPLPLTAVFNIYLIYGLVIDGTKFTVTHPSKSLGGLYRQPHLTYSAPGELGACN